MSGPLQGPKDASAEILAAVAAVRTFLGVPNATEADERIHRPVADDRVDAGGNLIHPRPRIIIAQGPTLTRTKIGTTTFASEGGTLFWSFEKDVSDPDDLRASLAAFEAELDAIWAGVEAIAGIGTAPSGNSYMNVEGFDLAAGPGTTDPEEEDGELFHGAMFLVEWR